LHFDGRCSGSIGIAIEWRRLGIVSSSNAVTPHGGFWVIFFKRTINRLHQCPTTVMPLLVQWAASAGDASRWIFYYLSLMEAKFHFGEILTC